MEQYEINEDTLALIPVSYYKTKIKELDNEFIINNNTYEVIKKNCEYFGSTYDGRCRAARKMLDCSYKLPVLIEESNNVIFFPTKSGVNEDCGWINYKHVQKVKKINGKSHIVFINGDTIGFNVSKMSLDNQLFKSARLESIMRERRK